MLSRRKIETIAKEKAARKAANLAALLTPSRSLHRGTYEGGTTGPAPKSEPLESIAYERAVRDLGYCMNCGWIGRPQFCHRDACKGAGIKTDSREGWPGCDACHALLGGHKGGGRMPKEERRALELELGRRTREAVKAAGTWPRSLAPWSEL